MKRSWPYRELAFRIQEAERLLGESDISKNYEIIEGVINEIDYLYSKGISNDTVRRAGQKLYDGLEGLKRTLNL